MRTAYSTGYLECKVDTSGLVGMKEEGKSSIRNHSAQERERVLRYCKTASLWPRCSAFSTGHRWSQDVSQRWSPLFLPVSHSQGSGIQ